MMAASLGTFGRIWSATARHWVLAASGVSWAKAVAMKAETTRRPDLPARRRFLRNTTAPHASAPCDGLHFTDPAGESWTPADIKEIIASGKPFQAHAFEHAC